MTEAARVVPGDKALEIGGGSGYQAAILAQLGATVWTIEINPRLAKRPANASSAWGTAMCRSSPAMGVRAFLAMRRTT